VADKQQRPYPGLVYNIVTMLGASLALFGLAASVILYVMNTFGFTRGSNPYLGIFILIVFPSIMVFGLLLIPLGMFLEKKRRDRHEPKALIINLANRHHRNVIVTFITGTCIFLLVTTVGLYETFHYTESVEFCGEVCHTVMEPEKVAYLNSPHARVLCVNCHIGPGAEWYVKSKMSGLRQVYKVATNSYPTPIETPIHHLRPAQDLCETCHWPQKFHATTQFTRHHFLSDEENSHWRVDLLVKVGGTTESPEGKASGAHWHVDPSNQVSYVAGDSSRQSIDAVMVKRGDETITYTHGGRPMPDSVLARKEELDMLRVMDCMDCHNRPAHIYRSPMEGVNEAMAAGKLDRRLPWIKREAVRALSREYATSEGARDSIALHLKGFYAGLGFDTPPAAIAVVQEIYAENMFPKMKVRWDRYPNDIGHFYFPGCFRCHGSDLATPDGKTITSDCNTCHTILSQGFVDGGEVPPVAPGLPFQHPIDIGGSEQEMRCYDCHKGDDSLYLLTNTE
jgi:hypothetical protein